MTVEEKKWASEDDQRKAQDNLFVYGNCVTKNIDGVLYHIPLHDVYITEEGAKDGN